ncbi:flavodoxin [Spiroplasma culicicola]|uniref:Flavodoxin n=1 Tax=Spiroplasma culicicola AES-1 TaxID=1276246 RepID=W6A6T9_9MOLU|nr:flavodoxin [Spiroplasma culicicola]AHI52833.1 flavodoxin [Spiroplasma culicicola AES-1]
MSKAKIVYASQTKNTEEIAYIVSNRLEKLGVEVDIEECWNATPKSFQEYDICIVATYTYGDGDIPDELIDFYYDLKKVDLKGKIYGTCGSGDRFYEHFAVAVDDFAAAFEQAGAIKGSESVKIELDPKEEDIQELEKFCQQLVDKLT